MNQKLGCEQFRTFIYCLDEPFADSGLSPDERKQLSQHLLTCDHCRQIRNLERDLTNQLVEKFTPSSTPSGKPIVLHRFLNLPVLIACSILMGVSIWISGLLIGSGNRAAPFVDSTAFTKVSFGSIVSKPIVGGSFENAEPRLLDSNNHIDLPSGSSALVELSETGRVDVIGPAVLEIDRTSQGWKITLVSGRIKATLNGKKPVVMVCRKELLQLEQGTYFVSTENGIVQEDSRKEKSSNQEKDEKEIDKMIEKGLSAFRADMKPTQADFKKSGELLSKVFENKKASSSQKLSAGFYGVAAFVNSGQYKAALELGTKWQMAFKGKMGATMPVLMARAHFASGQVKKAKKIAKDVLKKYPKTMYREILEGILGSSGPARNRNKTMTATRPPYTSAAESKKFIAGQKQGYLVVNVNIDDQSETGRQFRSVSKKVMAFHKAKSIEFDGKDFSKLRRQIAKHQPRHVLFVISPKLLDVNFHRKIFKIAPTLDNDLFVDFSWGYLTARNGTDLAKFWNRIEKLHHRGIANKNWLSTGVMGGKSKSYTIKGAIPPTAKSAGFKGNQFYFGLKKNDPKVFDFIDQHKSVFETASIITMTGNGDPQGIWLFDGARNADRSRHWKFDKNKIGHDPENEMARLKSPWFASLNLNAPVIWSGTCHSGACYRVYVEGDIVSTFGTSDKTEVYDLPPDESLCLSMISAGAGSLLVPVASNHGFAVSLETDFMIKHGATLGDTIASTYNDAILQAGGIPKLVIAKQGDPHSYWGEPVMQAGAANRILIGDPALRVIKKSQKHPKENQMVDYKPTQKQIKVKLSWSKGNHPCSWNLFSDGRGYRYRMRSRIDCSKMPELASADRDSIKCDVEMVDDSGKKIVCDTIVALESIGGKTFLHVQASANKPGLPSGQHRATFTVTWK